MNHLLVDEMVGVHVWGEEGKGAGRGDMEEETRQCCASMTILVPKLVRTRLGGQAD